MVPVASRARYRGAVPFMRAVVILLGAFGLAGCGAPAPLTASRDVDAETASDLRAAIPLFPRGAAPRGARPLGPVHGVSCMRSLIGRPASEADALDRLRYRARLMGADGLGNVACAPERVIVGAAEGCIASVACEGTALARPAPPPAADVPPPEGISNGLVVSARGDVLTLARNVAGCAALDARGADGIWRRARPGPVDAANDLALLRVDHVPLRVAVFGARGAVRPGDAATLVGHAPAAARGDRPLVISGQVAGLGAGGDSRLLRVAAADLAAARGAPLVDGRGIFVGLMAGREGLAIGAPAAKAFLLAEGVPIAEREAETMPPPAAVADIGASLAGALVALSCASGP